MEDGSSKEFTKIGIERINSSETRNIKSCILQHKRNGIQFIHAPQKAFHT